MELNGVAGIGAVYLVESGKSCLIDCGSQAEVPGIVKTLKKLNAFPPDYVLLTHTHYEHCQGVPYLRNKAKREQKALKVFAGENAIPLLEDQSFNKVFDSKMKLKNIRDVSPLKDGAVLDLQGLTLKIINIPGHSKDSIAIYDETNKNIFTACNLGLKFGEPGTYFPPIMHPFWNKDDYFKSLDKLSLIDFEGICLGHFGYLFGEEAENFLSESRKATKLWLQLFETLENDGMLDDLDNLTSFFMKEANIIIPDLKVRKFTLKFMLGFLNGLRKIIGKDPISPGEFFLPELLGWQANGYKISKNID